VITQTRRLHTSLAKVAADGFLGESTALSAIPPEDQPPLLIDSYGMEALQVATQFFEVITRRNSQVLICCRVINHLKLAKQSGFKVRRDIFSAGQA